MARQNQISRRHLLWLVVALLAGLMLAIGTASAMARSASPTSPMQVTGHIRGSVRTPGNMPVDGGWIHMRGEAGQPERGAPIVANGCFSITDLLPGPYTIIAHPVEDSPYAASEPRLVHILSGQWASETLRLTDVRISGWVQDRDTLARIAGVGVVAHDIAWTIERWDVTNITGEFKIGAVTDGMTYILDVVPPPGTAYVPLGHYPVVPPATKVLEMYIPPTSVIGLVRRPDGTSVPGAGVVVFREGSWLETQADGGGGFLFRGLPAGEFWIQATPPWGPDGRGLAASVPFTIPVNPPAVTTGVVITLQYASKTLAGQVVLAGTSNGVPDALVRAHRLDEPGYADGPTGPDGRFILNLPGGEWHVDVQPLFPPAPWIFPGPPAWVVFPPPPTAPETKTVTLEVLPTNARVAGRVICPDYDVVHDIPCPSGPPHDAMWVELRNDAIRNSARLGPDYRFEIPIPDGWYELVVHLNHPGLQAPPPFPVYVGPGQTLPLPDIRLLPKDAHIVGRVVHEESGQGIPGVPVFGWQPEGFGQGQAETDANGFYDMPVIGGEWFVEPRPGPERPYVFRQPLRRVRVGPGGMMAGVDLGLTYAGARIEGMAVDAHTTAPLWGLDGWAWARLFPSNDLFSDAPLRDGSFMLKVQGEAWYKVGLDLPPRAPYVSGSAGPVSVTPAASVFMTVPLEHKDAGVQGRLIVAGTMTLALGVRGEVFGEDGQGHRVVASVNPMNATYGLGLISGTWHLRAWVDPASGYVAVPTTTVVAVQATQVISPVNFEAWRIDATISGQVLPPIGVVTPVQAFVFAEGNSPFVGHFEAHTWSDPAGHFELHVPEGGYRVGAGLPDDELRALGWLNPRPLDFPHVSVANPVTDAMLRFRQWDGDIHGTIAFAPGIVVTPNHPAYVRGWSDTGEWAETGATEVTGTNTFTYALHVISGTTWHVGAVYEDPPNGHFYESPEVVVPVMPPIISVQQDLVLGGPYTLPQPFIVSFDASQMQTIIMPDGVELSIPPGALAVSGTMTLFIFPTQEMRPEPGHEIIGAGYEIRAVDQNGQQVTRFNQNVAMTLYYSEADLAMHHVSEHMLIPVYYSTLAGQWIPADSYVVDTVHDLITLQISHFTKFGIMSIGPAKYYIYLPLVLKNFR
jgi:hypothetical protein